MNPITVIEFATLLTAIVGYMAFHWKVTREDQKKLAESHKIVKDNVVNSHSINLRDDMDKKHEEVLSALNRMDDRQLEIEKRLHDERRARELNDNAIKDEHKRLWRAIYNRRKL